MHATNFSNNPIETKQQFNLSFEIVKKKDDNTSNFTEIYVRSFFPFSKYTWHESIWTASIAIRSR